MDSTGPSDWKNNEEEDEDDDDEATSTDTWRNNVFP